MRKKAPQLSRFFQYFLFINVILNLSSCSSTLLSIYGIKSDRYYYTSLDVQKLALSYGIKPEQMYFLQKSYIEHFDSIGLKYGYNVGSCDTSQVSQQIKNHFQPLQILFFDKSGKLVSFQTNCYYGGFPNFRWNRNHELDYIPAKGIVPLDTLISFSDMLNNITDIYGSLPEINHKDQEYFILVFWTSYMGRQSKRLIHTVNKKYNQLNYQNVNTIFVNADCCAFNLYY